MADRQNNRYDRYTTRRRQVEFRDDPAPYARDSYDTTARPRSASNRTRTGSESARDTAGYSTRSARSPRSTRRSSAPRYSDSEIRRNRIIALAVLLVAVALIILLLVNLVSCAAHALGGGAQDTDGGSGDSTAQVEENQTQAAADTTITTATQTLASNEGVEDPWVEGGRFTTGDAELDEMVKKVCDENSKPGASAADNAFNAYCAVVWSDYVENDENQYPTGTDWDIEYAKQMFRNNAGNCYEFAAADEYVLKYFGYTDVYAEPCLVYRESGSYGDHGLTFATDFDGRKCMCDSSFGANGWLIDADSYTMQVVDVGQDPSEFEIADFEKVAKASWA